jgi:cytidyltransferase-like protein
VLVHGSFDDLRSRHVRLLQEASKLGALHVLLASDSAVRRQTGTAPQFPQEERLYVVENMRYVHRAVLYDGPPDAVSLPHRRPPDLVAGDVREDRPDLRAACVAAGVPYRLMTEDDLRGFPAPPPPPPPEPGRQKVLVTGCYDWFHSGHVRFFEEISALGDLYVVVGSDANVRLLKGAGHPLLPQDERRYLVQAVRFVREALVSTGTGWMDAEPEILRLRPDLYVVNEDGDKPEKRAFCAKAGIRYVVLKRLPKKGLPARTSTNLRGF